MLRRVADGIDARAEELARVETRDNGSLLRSHRRSVMPRVGMNFRFFADFVERNLIIRAARSAATASGSAMTRLVSRRSLRPGMRH